MRNLMLLLASSVLALSFAAAAAPGDPVFETCPRSSDIGNDVACYPLTFMAKTELHPHGVPLIAYLFVPTDAPDEPLPAMVMAHGSGSMYSSGNHNKGLNNKHIQWVHQYTSEKNIVTLHVSSFHSLYMLEDTPGDQRILDWENSPTGLIGGDDYRATSFLGSQDDPDRTDVAFDPERDDFKEKGNRRAGVSEILERPYHMDAAADFLAGRIKGRMVPGDSRRNKNDDDPSLGTPLTEIGTLFKITGTRVDHERIFLYGTSHGGQAAMATAHEPRATAADNPMGDGDVDGKRFAGFFDYYGGCGLFGAYGGADKDGSTWQPYGPFLMLHGENDGIWGPGEGVDTRERWKNGKCKARIDAYKDSADYDTFLEAVLYEGAHHSFDGVERDDFTDEAETAGEKDFDEWAAKIHANERLTLPMIDAISRIISAERNSAAEVPTLGTFGFDADNPYFSTWPLTPMVPPRVNFEAIDLYPGEEGRNVLVRRPEFADAVFMLQGAFNIYDPLDIVSTDEFGCDDMPHAAPDNVTFTLDGSFPCSLDIELNTDQVNDLYAGNPIHFVLPFNSPWGTVNLQLIIEAWNEYPKWQVRLLSTSQKLPNDTLLEKDLESTDQLQLDYSAILWTYPDEFNPYWPMLDEGNSTFPDASYAIVNDLRIVGPAPANGDNFFIQSILNGSSDRSWFTIANGADAQKILITGSTEAGSASGYSSITFPTRLPETDFVTNYSTPALLDNATPMLAGEFPSSGNGDSGSGGNDPGDNDPGDNDPGDNDPGDNDPGGSNTGGDNPGNGSGGGGGALFWLLPALLLARRRR